MATAPVTVVVAALVVGRSLYVAPAGTSPDVAEAWRFTAELGVGVPVANGSLWHMEWPAESFGWPPAAPEAGPVPDNVRPFPSSPEPDEGDGHHQRPAVRVAGGLFEGRCSCGWKAQTARASGRYANADTDLHIAQS